MKRFQFRLESLLKYRAARRDHCRQLLAQLLADDRALVDQKRTIGLQRDAQLAELRDIGRAGQINVDGAISRRYFAARLNAHSQAIEHQRTLLAGQLELCRRALSKADQDVRVLEKLKEKRQAEHQYEQERRSSRELDETWMAAHLEEFTR